MRNDMWPKRNENNWSSKIFSSMQRDDVHWTLYQQVHMQIKFNLCSTLLFIHVNLHLSLNFYIMHENDAVLMKIRFFSLSFTILFRFPAAGCSFSFFERRRKYTYNSNLGAAILLG